MTTLNHIIAFGASKNIGYFTCRRFLEIGCKVTFVLRSPDVFDKDEDIQLYVEAGFAQLVKGDALSETDVRNGWNQAHEKFGPVDLCLFTVGGTPRFTLTKGFVIDPPNLVTQALLNVLCTYPMSQSPLPRIIILSSTGITQSGHKTDLPLVLKPMYKHLIGVPHRDKLGAELALAYVGGLPWDEADYPGDEVMGSADWKNRAGLPPKGALAGRVLIVKPSLLTDGPCLADENPTAYRVSEKGLKGYTVSRRDVAHFVFNVSALSWDEYAGKIVNISY